MGWKGVVRAVAYFKDKDYASHYGNIALRRGLSIMPCIGIQADVGRDNLLFEMELDAAVLKA